MDRIKRWTTKIYHRLFKIIRRTKRFRVTAGGKPERKETYGNTNFLTEFIAEGTCRAMEWSSGERKNSVMHTLEKVF